MRIITRQNPSGPLRAVGTTTGWMSVMGDSSTKDKKTTKTAATKPTITKQKEMIERRKLRAEGDGERWLVWVMTS